MNQEGTVRPLKDQLGLNGLKQFLNFLQPRRWIYGTLEIPNCAFLVHNDGGGALDPDEILIEFIIMVNMALRIG